MSSVLSKDLRATWLRVSVCAAAGLMLTGSSLAQGTRVTQTAGVSNSRTGAYAALAQLTLESFERGDLSTAAELARILERTWDRGEELGGEDAIRKRDANLFEQIDSAMDAFIKPIIHGAKGPAEPKEVKANYMEFVKLLTKAD